MKNGVEYRSMIYLRNRKVNEASAGDRKITKAIVLDPEYIPDRLVDDIEEFHSMFIQCIVMLS